MRRPLNFFLILVVAVFGVSLWMAQGRPLPGFLSGEESGTALKVLPFQDPDLEPVHLSILNGTDQAGLAGDLALLITRVGCVVEGVGNAAPWPGSSSMLINRRLSPARAGELAERLGGIPVLQEFDGRTTEDAVLILGEDAMKMRTLLNGLRP